MPDRDPRFAELDALIAAGCDQPQYRLGRVNGRAVLIRIADRRVVHAFHPETSTPEPLRVPVVRVDAEFEYKNQGLAKLPCSQVIDFSLSPSTRFWRAME